MTEKFVRDCDNVKDITKVDFIMARQSDLIHTTDGKEWVMNNGKPEQISGAVTNIKNVAGAVTFQNTLGGAGDTNVNVGSVKFAPSDFNVTSSPTYPEQITVSAIPKDSDWMELTLINGFTKANNTDSRARVRTRNNQEYLEVDLYNIKCPAIAANTNVILSLLPDAINAVLKADNITAINWTNITHVSVATAGENSQPKHHLNVRTTSAVTVDQLIAINFTVPMK